MAEHVEIPPTCSQLSSESSSKTLVRSDHVERGVFYSILFYSNVQRFYKNATHSVQIRVMMRLRLPERARGLCGLVCYRDVVLFCVYVSVCFDF